MQLDKYSRVLITGCAGFIGSNLCDRLLALGCQVKGIDNFSTGQRRFLGNALSSDRFRLITADLLDLDKLSPHFNDVDLVFHFAANADVRFGTQHPTRDLEQNTIATSNVLECMRLSGCQQIAFSSTGSVYGEAKIVPTPECAPFPVQTSLYGASKLACEGLISAYTEGFGFKGWIFRFVSILGERYTHGHVFDFYKQLLSHPDYLTVLGDGTQKKSYLYIQDCLDAIVLAIRSSDQPVNIFNLGVDAVCEVRDSVRLVCDRMSLNPEIRFSGGDRGWIGDNPMIHLDVSKIEDLGWKPKLTIKESIIRTVEYLDQNHWVLDVR